MFQKILAYILALVISGEQDVISALASFEKILAKLEGASEKLAAEINKSYAKTDKLTADYHDAMQTHVETRDAKRDAQDRAKTVSANLKKLLGEVA
jgi:hypothetical protein